MDASPDLFINKGISQQSIYQFYNEDIKLESFVEYFNVPANDQDYKRYVLIIDEINRGNVSSIFGELITLIESDKRKGIKEFNPEYIELELPYSNKKFSVPDNLYIIGTMNSADRSVEALDTALRRRFSFIEMQPDPEILLIEHQSKAILTHSDGTEVNLASILEAINQRIELLIDKDHQIGHSFFIKVKSFEELTLVFKDNIIPLLEEYFFGDFGKIGLVLGGEFIKQKSVSAKFPANFKYGEDGDTSSFSDKIIYEFTSADTWTARTFTSIYE
jgi:5-methylcytosine-specific restriction endonuclease McrBC GTP-binding regulatory subunit McrB